MLYLDEKVKFIIWKIREHFYNDGIYLIGGFVRDLFLGRKNNDLDFIIYPFDFIKLQEFSKVINGKIFFLDEERKYIRINVGIDDEEYSLDFTPPIENNLIKEIIRRDFTINTITISLNNFKIIDPLRGIKDLLEGNINVCTSKSLIEDPLRILRAFRFSSNLGFKINHQTQKEISKNAIYLNKVKGERIHNEIYKILKGPFTSYIWLKMHELKVLKVILPELSNLENIPWSPPHSTNPLIHTFSSLGILEFLYYYLDEIFEEYSDKIREHLNEKVYDEFTRRELIKIAVLLHDIGKEKYFIDEKNKVHYYGHENLGSLMIENIAERWRLSGKEKDLLKKLVKYHLYPAFIFRDNGEKLKIINKMKEDTISLMLLFLADHLSIHKNIEVLDFAKSVIRIYLEKKDLKPILSGNEIMEILNLKPSPLIGYLKDKLLMAQQKGLVKSKEEAIDYLEKIMKDESFREKDN